MKIVGVSACITGVAHTYMAQEAIEQECKKRGFDVKVETQGGLGIENELSEDEVNEADAVILAVAIGIEGMERFEEKEDEGRVLTVNPADVIHDPAGIIADPAAQLQQQANGKLAHRLCAVARYVGYGNAPAGRRFHIYDIISGGQHPDIFHIRTLVHQAAVYGNLIGINRLGVSDPLDYLIRRRLAVYRQLPQLLHLLP